MLAWTDGPWNAPLKKMQKQDTHSAAFSFYSIFGYLWKIKVTSRIAKGKNKVRKCCKSLPPLSLHEPCRTLANRAPQGADPPRFDRFDRWTWVATLKNMKNCTKWPAARCSGPVLKVGVCLFHVLDQHAKLCAPITDVI